MKLLPVLSLSLVVSTFLVGCGGTNSTQEEPTRQIISQAEQNTTIDNTTAEKAAVANGRTVFATGETRSFIAKDDGATKRGSSRASIDTTTHLKWQTNPSSNRLSWSAAMDYCQALTIDGESGWRVPTFQELQTHNDLSKHNGGKYWSSIEYPYDSNKMAYYIDFSQGFSADYGDRSGFEKSNRYHVRCVKGDKIPHGTFTRDDAKEIVTDSSTQLMWEDDAHIERTSGVENAIQYCENLSLGGYTDWHLPNLNEIYTIADRSHYDAAVDAAFTHTLSIGENNNETAYRAANYWTSTYYGQHPSLKQVHYYRTFNERDAASHRCRYYMGMHTRCVRAVK